MENLKKASAFINKNGVLMVANQEVISPRSVILYNYKTGYAYSLSTKCKNVDKFSIIRATVKGWLAAEREVYLENTKKDAVISKKKAKNPVSEAFGAQIAFVTDKDKNVMPSGIMAQSLVKGEALPLRNVLTVKKSEPLYKLVVVEGRDWSDPVVGEQLRAWTSTSVSHLDLFDRIDLALEKAADDTEKKEAALEKAMKEAEKKEAAAKKKAAKTAEQKVEQKAA